MIFRASSASLQWAETWRFLPFYWLFVRPFVRSFVNNLVIILLHIGIIGLWSTWMKQTTLKAHGHTTPKLDLKAPGGGIILEPFGRVGFLVWPISASRVTLIFDSESWQFHPLASSSTCANFHQNLFSKYRVHNNLVTDERKHQRTNRRTRRKHYVSAQFKLAAKAANPSMSVNKQ